MALDFIERGPRAAWPTVPSGFERELLDELAGSLVDRYS